MKREAVLQAIRSAGASGDQQRFLRLYSENRISLEKAQKAYREGVQFAKFIHERDRMKSLADAASQSDDASSIELADLVKEIVG